MTSEVDREIVFGRCGGSREFQIRLIFFGERWEVVDFESVGVNDSEAEAVWR